MGRASQQQSVHTGEELTITLHMQHKYTHRHVTKAPTSTYMSANQTQLQGQRLGLEVAVGKTFHVFMGVYNICIQSRIQGMLQTRIGEGKAWPQSLRSQPMDHLHFNQHPFISPSALSNQHVKDWQGCPLKPGPCNLACFSQSWIWIQIHQKSNTHKTHFIHSGESGVLGIAFWHGVGVHAQIL